MSADEINQWLGTFMVCGSDKKRLHLTQKTLDDEIAYHFRAVSHNGAPAIITPYGFLSITINDGLPNGCLMVIDEMEPELACANSVFMDD